MSDENPFLKWPGGKRWISNAIKQFVSCELDERRGRYIEPFLGAGSVFLTLRPKRALLADINADLISFLQIVRNEPEKVVDATRELSNQSECYYRVRSSCPRSRIRWAARFLYLNRTCWGGVYRENKRGEFNVPFGNSGRAICNRKEVVSISKRFRNVKLRTQDFEVSFSDARHGDVVYADPPYTSKGQYNGFVRYNENLFSWKDQVRLSKTARKARRRGAFVIISGVMHRDVLSLYRNWWVASIHRESTIAKDVAYRKTFNEALIFSRKPKQCVDEILVQQITDLLIDSVPHHP